MNIFLFLNRHLFYKALENCFQKLFFRTIFENTSQIEPNIFFNRILLVIVILLFGFFLGTSFFSWHGSFLDISVLKNFLLQFIRPLLTGSTYHHGTTLSSVTSSLRKIYLRTCPILYLVLI